MSGGSFNYLCNRETEDLLDLGGDELLAMRAELAERPDGALAVAMIDSLVATLSSLRADREAFRQRCADVDVSRRELNAVFHAVEWWRSADWGEDRVIAALAKLNGQ